MQINRRHFIASAAAFAASPARAQPLDWSAAKQEGSVTIYNTGVGLHRDVAGAFTARYGIKVNFLDMRASELRERVRLEQSSGRFQADLCLNGSTGAIIMDRAGHFEAHGGLPNEPNILPGLEGNGVRIPIFVNMFGFMVNTGIVTADKEPKSFRDLLDPFSRTKFWQTIRVRLAKVMRLSPRPMNIWAARFNRCWQSRTSHLRAICWKAGGVFRAVNTQFISRKNIPIICC